MRIKTIGTEATPEGTLRYLNRHGTANASLLGRTGLMVSGFGFGGYRAGGRLQNGEHAQALALAIESGFNLIDTSANYTDGNSERMIGEVLESLFKEEKASRDEIVVITKAGYIQGENLSHARRLASAGTPFPEVVEYDDECWHCLSPRFLEDQITRSLSRLRLQTIDVLLLHNPEYYLKANRDHEEYYRRIARAFEHLEEEARRGRIRNYGVSSNSFPEPKESAEFTSLSTLIAIARSLGPDHRFSVIQLPLNLFEPGAAFENNNDGRTACETALDANLGVLVNRPLNAFDEIRQRMVRLADFPSHDGKNTAEAFRQRLKAALELESRYAAKDIVPSGQVAWGHILNANLEKIRDIDSWKRIATYQIEPQLFAALDELDRHAEHASWAAEYRLTAKAMLLSLGEYFEWREAQESKRISARLNALCPSLSSSKTLSQKAVRLCRAMPGVSSVLVGMRRLDYVKDMLTANSTAAADRQTALKALREFSGEQRTIE